MTTPDAGQRLIEDLRGKAVAMLCAYTGRCVADLPEEEIHRMICSLDAVFGPEIERLRGVEDNARRYRWLRDIGDHTFRPLSGRSAIGAIAIDSAIDAAIAASRSTGADHA